MKSRPHTGAANRLTMLAVMIAATLTMSAQSLFIRPTINADKATPEINGTLNALQGSGSISFRVDLIANVSEISEATITINGESHNLTYSIDEQGDKAIFDPYTISFDEVTSYSDIKASVTFKVASEYFQTDNVTQTAEYPNNIKVWGRPSVSFEGPTPEWGIMSGGSTALKAVATGGNDSAWSYKWSNSATTSSIDYTATNNSGSTRQDEVTVTATNLAPDGTSVWNETQHTFTVAVYSTANATARAITPSNVVFAGTTVNFGVDATGGNSDTWNYNRTGTDNNSGATSTYQTINTGSTSVNHIASVTVTNTSPDGDSWFNKNLTFPVTVWPVASATLNAPERTEWIKGENVPLSVQTTGGDASKWTYAWTVDGQPVSNNTSTYNYVAVNNGQEAATHTIAVTATNTPDGINEPQIVTQSYTCTVYPSPAITSLTVDNNVIFSGNTINVAAQVAGGKPDGWNYSWTINGYAATDFYMSRTLTDMPKNEGTGPKTFTYEFTAVNTCGENQEILKQEITVTVWPTPVATLNAPERTEWFNGENVALEILPDGGDESKWTYSWNVDGQDVANNGTSFNYTAVNNGTEAVTRTITVTATNTPDGINEPARITRTYTCTVYPTPTISSLNVDKDVIFSGNTINIAAHVSGGNPEGWHYEWSINNIAATDFKALTLTDTPVNNGTSSITTTYELKAINSCGGKEEILTRNINVTVWPAPVATLNAPERTEWINGEAVALSMASTGGDSDSWTYTWSVDEQTISENSASYNYVAFNNSDTGVNRVITVTATNTPAGIDKAYTTTQTYSCIVYPTPAIREHSIDKPVVYSGTSISMGATLSGGNPQGWNYSWTLDGNSIAGNEPNLNTIPPVNNSTQSSKHTYRLTAVNTCASTTTTLTQDFEITVWPVASAAFNSPARVEWLNGEVVALNVVPAGGDSNAWTYVWEVDGQAVNESTAAFNYVANNTGATGARRTITVTATNTPQGIDAPFVYKQTYSCTVYPTPSIDRPSIDKPVTYSGTPVRMSIVPLGGLPTGWTYTWTKNGAPIAGSTSLSDAPVNNGTDRTTYTYVVTAVNTLDDQVNSFSESFTVTVWPTPSAMLADNLPDDIISGDVITLPVTVAGGDASAWNIKWSVDGTVVQNSQSTTFDFTAINTNENGSRNSVVTADITNAPDGIDNAFTASYSHTFVVWPGPTAISLLDNFQVTCGRRSLTLGVNAIGGQASNWTFAWTKNGSQIAHNEASMPVTFVNNGTTMITEVYTVTSTNTVEGEVRYQNTETYTVNIYPEPSTQQGIASMEAYYDSNVTMDVVPTGGYPQGWKYEWSDDLPDAASVTYNVPTSSSDSYNKTITLTVTNGYENVVWSQTTYTYDITCWSRGEITSATTLDANYNGNINLTLNTNRRGGYVNGWTYEWYLNGELQADGQPSLAINETNYDETVANHNWVLVATNTLNGETGSRTEIPYTYALWPVIETPTTFDVSQANVSNGSTIVLSVAPQAASGGYMYQWNYEWTANGSPVNNNNPVVTVTAAISDNNSMAYGDIVYGLRLTNPAPDGGFWFDRTYTERTVRVYNRPETPTQLERKGNGTTCTMIALTALTDAQLTAYNYTFVFGYTDALGVDHEMPTTTNRYYRYTSDIFNNQSNDFWVYTRWSYDNGVTVTSNRRHLNGSVDDYDGSSYETSGRGDSAGSDNIIVDDDDIYVDARGFKVNLTTVAEASVRIINTSGNVVFQNKYPASDSFSEKFNKATLVPGVYIVTVEAGTSVKIKKIVIK